MAEVIHAEPLGLSSGTSPGLPEGELELSSIVDWSEFLQIELERVYAGDLALAREVAAYIMELCLYTAAGEGCAMSANCFFRWSDICDKTRGEFVDRIAQAYQKNAKRSMWPRIANRPDVDVEAIKEKILREGILQRNMFMTYWWHMHTDPSGSHKLKANVSLPLQF